MSPSSPTEQVLELRARPAGVIALTSTLIVACALLAMAQPKTRVWCIAAAVMATIWARWRLRRVERFRIDSERGLLERSGAPPLEWRSARQVVVKDPEQEAPTIATVMVDLGRARWVPVYFGPPDVAAQVAEFLESALPRSASAPPAPAPPEPQPLLPAALPNAGRKAEWAPVLPAA